MSWSRRFRLRQYLRSSLWVVPVLGALVGAVAAPVDVWVDKAITLPPVWQYSASTASTMLTTVVGATAALTGFVVTVAVLVVQMATGTFSARYMRLWYRDRLLKGVLAVLIGTLTFSLSMLRRVTPEFVPNLGITVDGFLVVASLILFLLFLDRFLHRMRPVAFAALCAGQAGATIVSAEDVLHLGGGPIVLPRDEPVCVVTTTHGGAIQAVDVEGLVDWANHRDSLVVLRHTVGDFVPSDSVLMEVHGRADDIDVRRLRGLIAIGHERTIEQDPAFSIRVMVDIAIKALSAAINDPTTAVQVIAYLGEALQNLGRLPHPAWAEGRHEDGRLGLLIRTRRWSDYLALAVTEIREYGADSVQVLRKLRAVLEELVQTVRPEHVAAVEEELARLDATVAAHFGDSVDFDRARVADRQGLGGPAAWEDLVGAPPISRRA